MYMDKYLSLYLCGFRRGYSAQHCLTYMLEQWNKALDTKHYTRAILTDLSKAFVSAIVGKETIENSELLQQLASIIYFIKSCGIILKFVMFSLVLVMWPSWTTTGTPFTQ